MYLVFIQYFGVWYRKLLFTSVMVQMYNLLQKYNILDTYIMK